MMMQSIVVATDFSQTSQAVLRIATTLALDTGVRLLIVHVEQAEVMYGGAELDLVVQSIENPVAEQLLEHVVPPDPRVPYEHHLLTGSTADELVRFARECRADLIVIGTHERTGPVRLLLGSIAHRVMRHAPCPVLTVKAFQLESLQDEPETPDSE